MHKSQVSVYSGVQKSTFPEYVIDGIGNLGPHYSKSTKHLIMCLLLLLLPVTSLH